MQPMNHSSEGRNAAINAIVELVVVGRLGVGQKSLTYEQELAEATSAEVEDIRRACAVMIRDGLMGQRPGQGVWIWPVSADELRQCLSLRSRIDVPAAVSLAASLERGKKVNAIEKVYRNFLVAATTDEWNVDRFIHRDALFHARIAAEGGYLTGAEIIETWGRKCRMLFARSDYHEVIAGSHIDIAASNDEIFRLLKGGDMAVAKASEAYLENWRHLLSHEVIDFLKTAKLEVRET
ncbi:hypothetical protein [Streptomyces sp. NBC_01236]|uniref:hypothetical protein n=1 Tax=Streptomyces sp. NBC_01236 TaxID=2903789 RepID=UPI002E13447E|nr:hypothetical protein OG324_24075 [Streptomyces sp. NBC_01236]